MAMTDGYPLTIFYTLFNIMMDVLKKDPAASFFFIGAEDEKYEPGVATRRFKVYVKDMEGYVANVIKNVAEVMRR